MKTIIKRMGALLLSCALLLAAVPAAAAADSVTGFPDVVPGDFYEESLHQMQLYTPGIISGLNDENGVLIFNPQGNIKRGEFLKMIMVAAEGWTADKSRNKIHWAGEYYTIALENNALVSNVYSGTEPMFPCTFQALEQPISRYEMAVILTNVCTNMLMEKTVVTSNPASAIADYSGIENRYTTAVEQAYGKGLLQGYEDGSFHGERNLRRCEAVMVIYRLLWAGKREMADFAEQPQPEVPSGNYLDPSLSFANWLRNGHVDSWGNIDAEARTRLFGSAYKTYFVSSADAANYMTTVTVPIWIVDKTGGKVASTCPITVNKAVAEEVKSIFQMIFDDPEQFPIYGGWSAGGARFTDTMRHSWGCAIDVNALFNCECNTKSGYLKVTCGYGWWPIGHADASFAGSMTGPSVYSIGKNPGEYGYSVVKAFATYGWGWGGNGWSGGKSFDYMHFSVLPSGG